MNCDEEGSMCYLFYIAATLLLLIIISLMVYYKLLSGTALTEQIVGRNKLKLNISPMYSHSQSSACLFLLYFHCGNAYYIHREIKLGWQQL